MPKHKHDRFLYHYFITLENGIVLETPILEQEGFKSYDDAEYAMFRDITKMLRNGVKLKQNACGIRAIKRDRKIPVQKIKIYV